MQLADCVNGGGFSTGNQAREVDAVAADIHQSAASENWIEADIVLGLPNAKAETGADERDLTDLSRPNRVKHAVDQRMRAIHKGFGEHESRLLGDVKHFL